MSLRARIRKLEAGAVPWDLTRLTDEELDALIACYQEADEEREAVKLTPELEAALERVRIC